jgi:hypothetical protein
LVEDSKNIDADTELQSAAADLAAQDRCVLIPIPVGKVPAIILLRLKELGVTEVKLALRALSAEIKDSLSSVDDSPEEIVGIATVKAKALERARMKAVAAEKKIKIVINALPNFKYGGSASVVTPKLHGIVRHVRSLADFREQKLIDIVKANNVTDIFVTGEPALAGQIVAELQNAGITPNHVSGLNAAETARKALADVVLKAKWKAERERRQMYENLSDIKAKIKERLSAVINNSESDLECLELEAAEVEASGASSTALATLRQEIVYAKAQIARARDDLNASRLSEARFRAVANLEARQFQFKDRVALKAEDQISEYVEDEESTLSGAEASFAARIQRLRGLLAEARARCFADRALFQKVVEKASSLRTSMKEAIDAKNKTLAAEIFKETKEFVREVRALLEQCKKERKVTAQIRGLIEKRESVHEKVLAQRAEVISRLRIAERTANETISQENVTTTR